MAGGVIAPIILAAGMARRMGSNKLIATKDGKPLIAHVADAIAAAGLPPPIVVLGHEPDAIRAALEGRTARYVVAPEYARGIAHSLAAGIAALPETAEAALICLGDMPFVRPDLLRALADRARPDTILIPRHDGVPGNPRVWGRHFFASLRALDGDSGGHQLVAGFADRIVMLDWDDDAILRDIDTPADLWHGTPRL